MATGSYSHYGFITDDIPSGSLTITGDLDMNNYSITNVNLLSAATGVFDDVIINNDLSVTGCINGGAGLPANLCEGAIIGKKLEMPIDQLLNTTNLLNVTTINNSGPPTSTPVEGSIAWTKTDNRLWVYDGGAWSLINAAGSTPTWAAVLAAGNTSGVTNPSISTGQKILFADNLKLENSTNSSNVVGFNNTNTIPSINLLLGNSNIVNATSNIVVGNGNASNFNNAVVIGNLATATAANQITFGTTLERVRIPGILNECRADAFQSSATGLRAVQIASAVGANNYLQLSGDVGQAVVAVVGTANSNLELNAKSAGTGQVIANVDATSTLRSLGFVESVKQSGASAAIRAGIDPVSNIGAGLTLPIPFTTINYNFFSNTKTTYVGVNRFLLEPLTAYTASFYYRATDPNTHTNNVDLRIYINLFDGTNQVMASQTIYYPNTKRASEGSCAATFFTNGNATQELTFVVQNTSNAIVRVVEFLGNVTRLN